MNLFNPELLIANTVDASQQYLFSLAVTEAGKVNGPLAKDFFRGEYKLNYLTGTGRKPYIAIIDGITMGGVSKYLCIIIINQFIRLFIRPGCGIISS